ncbi:ribbon-helix-helix protein, CopG family [Ornithinibacillus contaminans]|uniref:ribbon-helix-helix protein, CopG family n=1 Tax=Ornithinibacillus contaminans TaxID=694055 RepID=UPI00064D8824|nr:ribbon-helix-helix protein, CopG family [Ornithinibacillus contaminans]
MKKEKLIPVKIDEKTKGLFDSLLKERHINRSDLIRSWINNYIHNEGGISNKDRYKTGFEEGQEKLAKAQLEFLLSFQMELISFGIEPDQLRLVQNIKELESILKRAKKNR